MRLSLIAFLLLTFLLKLSNYPARWYAKIKENIEIVKQKISAKIPRIGIIPSNAIGESELQGIGSNDYEVDENSDESIIRVEGKGKGKGKGKSSNRATKSSIEL